jgi:hypothetical protein
MSWFRRWRERARAAPPPTLAVDPALGDPDAVRLRDAMGRGDWPAVRDFLAARTDPDDHWFYVDLAAQVEGAEGWLGKTVAAEPDSALALLLAGTREVRWACEARAPDPPAGGEAGDLSPERLRVFFQRLDLAEEHLSEALRRDPGAASTRVGLLDVAIGRELGIDETRRRFEQVLVRHPGHVGAHVRVLQQLCRTWGGSAETPHEFAWDAMMKVPPGSPLGYLVAVAHLEHWRSLDGGERQRYLTTDAVRVRLHEAAGRSVRHPAYRRRPGWPVAHNTFAMAFSLAGEHRTAAEQFRLIGDVVTGFPWRYLDAGDPGAAFLAQREASYRAAPADVPAD